MYDDDDDDDGDRKFVRNVGNTAYFQMTSELQHKTKLMALGPLTSVEFTQIIYPFHVHIVVSSKYSLLLRPITKAVAALSHSL